MPAPNSKPATIDGYMLTIKNLSVVDVSRCMGEGQKRDLENGHTDRDQQQRKRQHE